MSLTGLVAGTLGAALLAAGAVHAAPTAAPAASGWPCEVEPKAELSAASIWAPAGTAEARNWNSDPALARLVADVAPRSVPVADAGAQLAEFADRSPSPDATRAKLAAGLIDTIDTERRALIIGIRRFNGRQDRLARRIEQGYVAIDASGVKAAAPQATADEQVQWDTRIFEDRQRMLPVVCRQPAVLETRLMALVAALRAPPGIGVPVSTGGAAVPATYLVYVTNEGSGNVSIVDPVEQREIAQIAIGKRPRGLVASPDGKLLYVAVSGSPNAGPGVDESKLPPPDKAADGIVVIDLATRQVVRTLRGISDPEQIAISHDGSKLYVASEDTGKLIIIGSDGKMLGDVAIGGEPEGVSVSPDGGTILATSEGDNSVVILNGEPPAVVGRVIVGERPRNALFLGPERAVVPGEFDASLSIVDIKARKKLRTISLPKEDRPMGMAKLDGKTFLATTGRGGRLIRVDAETRGDPVTGSAAVGPRPWGLALAPDKALAFTANGSSNNISIVDTRSMSVIAKVEVGTAPWGATVVPTPR